MFVRLEIGFKADFCDPEADTLRARVMALHPGIGESIRWARVLNTVWLDLDAERDQVISMLKQLFVRKVTHWTFSGELLPSVSGRQGGLLDLMQSAPSRPGLFHGIEKRCRQNADDVDAERILEAVQMALGRKSVKDRVVTGKLLLMEGIRLSRSELEWIAKQVFAFDPKESWSLLSEEELKKNSRFQAEQVAQYFHQGRSDAKQALLRFKPQNPNDSIDVLFKVLEGKMRSPTGSFYQARSMEDEEFKVRAEIRLASKSLKKQTRKEMLRALFKEQLAQHALSFQSRIQSVLDVLPTKDQIWRETDQTQHPYMVQAEFEDAMVESGVSTGIPLVQMKRYLDSYEEQPAYAWVSTVGITEKSNFLSPEAKDGLELWFIGHFSPESPNDPVFAERLKQVLQKTQSAGWVHFAIPLRDGIIEDLKHSEAVLKYGFDLEFGNDADFLKSVLLNFSGIGQIWGVYPEKVSWLKEELERFRLPSFRFGKSKLSGEVRVTQNGVQKAKMLTSDFFGTEQRSNPLQFLLTDPVYQKLEWTQPHRLRTRFSVEELPVRPDPIHLTVASPVVFRPKRSSWSGWMILSDLCSLEFNRAYLEFLIRKCTALGGQIHSVQVSMVNGLVKWIEEMTQFQDEYGLPMTQIEMKVENDIQAHALALQVCSRVQDLKTLRSEAFKEVGDRVYWLNGDFKQASTRWLAGVEGRYQSSLRNAIAIEALGGLEGVQNTLLFALSKKGMGAEVRLNEGMLGGYFVGVSESERFAVEEEWRILEVSYEFVGRTTASPFLVVRTPQDQTITLSVEDWVGGVR